MKVQQFVAINIFTSLFLISCGESGGVPDVRRPEWNPQPVDAGVSPGSSDSSLPQPQPVDVTFPAPPHDDFAVPAKPVLAIDKMVLRFDPSPLYAIFIYEGTFQNYDEAVVTKNPAASVPANQACAQAEGRCWQSPLVISSCKDCDKLDPSKTYSAFLLRQSTEPLHTILMVPVVFE